MQVSYHNHHCTWSPDGAYVALTVCSRRKEGIFRSSVSASVVIVSRSSGIRSRRRRQQIRCSCVGQFTEVAENSHSR